MRPPIDEYSWVSGTPEDAVTLSDETIQALAAAIKPLLDERNSKEDAQ